MAIIVAPRAVVLIHRGIVVALKGAPAAPPKTSGQIWPRGKR